MMYCLDKDFSRVFHVDENISRATFSGSGDWIVFEGSPKLNYDEELKN